MPLVTVEDLASVRDALRADRVLLQNNPLSPDVLAFAPTSLLWEGDLPDDDNALGRYLQQHGLERGLLPDSLRWRFDVDTAVDAWLLGHAPGVGARTRLRLSGAPWVGRESVAAMAGVLTRPGAAVTVLGRVAPQAIVELNRSGLAVRTRVLSEERGMKALGRLQRGEVRSLLGPMYRTLGPEGLLEMLCATANGLIFDDRVLGADLGWQPSATDRFYADCLRPDMVQDAELRAWTTALHRCQIPLLLGGQNLVSGGLSLLIQRAKERLCGASRN